MEKTVKPIFLVVDDEAEVGKYFQNLAEENGWEAITATDSAEALEIFSKRNFSIVFIDIILPDNDGLTLLKELKKIPARNSLFVMITGKATNEQIHKSYTMQGAYTCIMKPFQTDKLKNLVQMMLSIDPQKFSENQKLRKFDLKKLLAALMIFIVTLIAALFFVSYEMYSSGYFKDKKGDFWQVIQKRLEKFEGYLQRDEERETSNNH